MSGQKVKDKDITTIAQEIEQYLLAHPNAVDSLEGIVKWWLTRQRYEEAIEQVQKSLDHLIDKGVILKNFIADGKVVYASAANNTNKNSDS